MDDVVAVPTQYEFGRRVYMKLVDRGRDEWSVQVDMPTSDGASSGATRICKNIFTQEQASEWAAEAAREVEALWDEYYGLRHRVEAFRRAHR